MTGGAGLVCLSDFTYLNGFSPRCGDPAPALGRSVPDHSYQPARQDARVIKAVVFDLGRLSSTTADLIVTFSVWGVARRAAPVWDANRMQGQRK